MADPHRSAAAPGFPRRCRLTRPEQFRAVFEEGRRFSAAHWTVVVGRSPLPQPRLGLAISRKAAPRAVDRNRVKRIVRESFRHRQTSLAGRDLVVLARPGIGRQSSVELRAALEQLWGKIARCEVSSSR